MLARLRAVLALGAYLLVLVVHVVAQVVDHEPTADVTQWLLAPVLALLVLVAPTPAGLTDRARGLRRWVLAGLGFSWLGDLLPHLVPDDDTAFVVLIGCFALAQASYAVGFRPFRRDGLLGTNWVFAYVAAATALVLVTAPGAGAMLAPVVGYAVLITTMAVLATGVHRLTGLGAALFLASDALIALEAFVAGWHLPGQSVWVMTTYGLAHLLIVLGVLARSAADGRDARVAGAGAIA